MGWGGRAVVGQQKQKQKMSGPKKIEKRQRKKDKKIKRSKDKNERDKTQRVGDFVTSSQCQGQIMSFMRVEKRVVLALLVGSGICRT